MPSASAEDRRLRRPTVVEAGEMNLIAAEAGFVELKSGASNAGTESQARSQELGDRTLIERAAQGDRAAFGRLYRAHLSAVYNHVLYRVRDEGLAEDITQETFVKAYRAIGGLREPERFRGWLFRIANNTLLNHLRHQSRRPEETDLEQADLPGGDAETARRETTLAPEEAAEHRLRVDEVLAAAERLTDLQRQVIALRFVSGLSAKETAAIMGRSTNAVHNLQHHGLAALRKALGERRLDMDETATAPTRTHTRDPREGRKRGQVQGAGA